MFFVVPYNTAMAHMLLYGGTFDPVHHGHLITCQKAVEFPYADRIVLIPAGLSPHKSPKSSGSTSQQRLDMLQLAIAGSPHFAIDPRELLRAGPSYTADTVEELEREHPGDRLTLLIGADQLPKFPPRGGWRSYWRR